MTDVTVLMPTFNRATVLRATLEAMCRVRTRGLSAEFVVIDNASTDATPQVLKEFAARLPLRWLRETAPGKSNALNRALRDVAQRCPESSHAVAGLLRGMNVTLPYRSLSARFALE
jgi:glycosyltransferase involved in cell wall biosynthesis